MTGISVEFRSAYARHRGEEARNYSGAALHALPYLQSGPFARQWQVRARTFDAFVRHVLVPAGRSSRLSILDLGAGNGWLCNRVARLGHSVIALDMRDDRIDGLGTAAEFLALKPGLFHRVGASFDELPFRAGTFDISLFNASLHYAQNLSRTVAEAARVTRKGGVIVILDSPFYAREEHGAAMVSEKRAQGALHFGALADVLLSQNFLEYLTRERLAAATPSLRWSRRRVLYPLWYELRPIIAWLKGKRAPSRFDLWTARVS